MQFDSGGGLAGRVGAPSCSCCGRKAGGLHRNSGSEEEGEFIRNHELERRFLSRRRVRARRGEGRDSSWKSDRETVLNGCRYADLRGVGRESFIPSEEVRPDRW